MPGKATAAKPPSRQLASAAAQARLEAAIFGDLGSTADPASNASAAAKAAATQELDDLQIAATRARIMATTEDDIQAQTAFRFINDAEAVKAQLDLLHRHARAGGAAFACYAWSAIRICATSRADGTRHPLPDWCADYLAKCAFRIELMAEGLDYRKPTAVRSFIEVGGFKTKTAARITPTEAARKVALALRITTRQGRNAFESSQSRAKRRFLLEIDERTVRLRRSADERLRRHREAAGMPEKRKGSADKTLALARKERATIAAQSARD